MVVNSHPKMKLGFRLLCITDRNATHGRDLAGVISDLIQAGLRGLQIREKDLPDAQFNHLAERIRKVTEEMPVRIFVNSRVDVARNMNAGLHLPDGSDIAGARKILGTGWPIGVSCHSLPGARAAQSAGASFVLVGPVFPTISKHPPTSTLGLDSLSEIAGSIGIPLVAVGGITPNNAPSCIEAGAMAVASVGNLLGADNARNTLIDFMRALGRL